MNRLSRDGLETSSTYNCGFGNEFATEAVSGTLPVGQNSPQKVAHGLYAEQISGTAFTAPRHSHRKGLAFLPYSPVAAPASDCAGDEAGHRYVGGVPQPPFAHGHGGG